MLLLHILRSSEHSKLHKAEKKPFRVSWAEQMERCKYVLKMKELSGETAIVYGQEGRESQCGVLKSKSVIWISLIPDPFSVACMTVAIWASLRSGKKSTFYLEIFGLARLYDIVFLPQVSFLLPRSQCNQSSAGDWGIPATLLCGDLKSLFSRTCCQSMTKSSV